MEYIKHSKKKLGLSRSELNLPKDFIFRLFGKVVEDLEIQVNNSSIPFEQRETLAADLKIARHAIRCRSEELLCKLGTTLVTQSTIMRRKVHCNGDAEAFFISYQLGAFMKKYPFRGIDTKTPAIQKFGSAEKECRLFNQMNYKAILALNDTYHPLYGGCIDDMRDDIEKLLGAIPDLNSVEVCAAHGPGMTAFATNIGKGETTNYHKWFSSLPYSVTAACQPYAERVIANDPRWIGALDDWYRHRSGNRFGPIDTNDFWSRVLKIVKGSRITTVPKTALIDRTIAIEPLMNVYLQLGIDRSMKRALKRKWGIDLSTQSLNQDLAKLGAEFGVFSTIDLSAASDRIALRICELLLPPAWYDLLLDLRSPKGELQGVWGSFDKISSMGNGFTFALETIIFAAISRFVMRRKECTKKLAVYGDDIVIPTECTTDVINLLGLCGFAINEDKTFTSGPFRESCGADYFLGTTVRPVFLTRSVNNVLDLFYVHNALIELEKSLPWHWDTHFEQARQYIRSYIPANYRYVYGPPCDTLDSYLFSDRRIPGVGQDRWHLQIVAKANKFNRNTSFFFRKLMAQLNGSHQAYENRWDLKRNLTTGNLFDVTRRDSVHYTCTKKRIYL